MNTAENINRDWGHSLAWGNPHTSPPEGMPLVIAEVTNGLRTLTDDVREFILSQWPSNSPFDYSLGCGYSFHLLLPIKKRKQWSEDTKAKARVKRKTTMLKKNYPLFADQLIERELG